MTEIWSARHEARGVALTVFVVCASVGLLVARAPHALPASASPRQGALHCTLAPAREVAPRTSSVGGVVTVTSTLQVACVDPRPLHAVLLVDASADMAGPPLDAVRGAILQAVPSLGLSNTLELGLVSLGGRPEDDGSEIVTYLTDDADRIQSGLRGLTAEGAPCLTCGLEDAYIVLRAGRGGLADDEVREVVFLASGGVDLSSCEAVQNKAREIRAHGVLLVTACAGPTCERRCWAEAATPRFAFRPDSWAFVTRLLLDLHGATGPFHPVARAVFSDVPAPGWAFSPAAPGYHDGRVRLELEPWPPEGLIAAYAASALDCGTQPISEAVGVELTFRDGRVDTVALPNPPIRVECVVPTTTPTATGSPAATATATLAPQASATPRLGGRALLPWAGRDACREAPFPRDVALALDVSGSMAAPWPPFPTRWHGAQAYAAAFVEALRPGDRAAVTAFADQPFAVHGLSADRAAVAAAIRSDLPRGDGSDIVAGIRASAAELPRGRERRLVIVTDVSATDLGQADRAALAAEVAMLQADGVVLAAALVGAPAAEPWTGLLTAGAVTPLDPAHLPDAPLFARCR